MNRRLTIGGAAAILAAAVLVLAACSHSSTQSGTALEGSSSAATEKLFLVNQPPPIFAHSEIRAVATEVEAIQALGEQTTSFFLTMGIQDPQFSCPSLGEPVASTSEITNPQQLVKDTNPGHNNSTAATLGNMDPNGIYPGNSDGTYVLCVNADGQPYAVYWEGPVASVSGPAVWDYTTHRLKVTGEPTMPTCTFVPKSQSGTGKAQTVCKK